MKKLMFTVLAVSAAVAFAAEEKKDGKAELVEQSAPIFWGFGNYGLYSGYQLYGSLLNNEPTLQGYFEGNMNLSWDDLDLGYLGLGIWSNTDLTRRRSGSFGNCHTDIVGEPGIGDAFNEWDFNIHWGRTFWFDDENSVGLTYRMSFVWYYYPGKYYQHIHPGTFTTFDWNHYFELTNPYVIPYINVVHEYLQSGGNLLQWGLKKPFQITDKLAVCPFIEMVWRDKDYNWCFPTQFGATKDPAGIASLKVELDTTYQLTENFGLFAKVAYCSIIDPHLRGNCHDTLESDDYGENSDFAWGGVGVTFNF